MPLSSLEAEVVLGMRYRKGGGPTKRAVLCCRSADARPPRELHTLELLRCSANAAGSLRSLCVLERQPGWPASSAATGGILVRAYGFGWSYVLLKTLSHEK